MMLLDAAVFHPLPAFGQDDSAATLLEILFEPNPGIAWNLAC
jgi:hypothetical protein